jgi:hypothetical protein
MLFFKRPLRSRPSRSSPPTRPPMTHPHRPPPEISFILFWNARRTHSKSREQDHHTQETMSKDIIRVIKVMDILPFYTLKKLHKKTIFDV